MRLPLPVDFFAPVRLSACEVQELKRAEERLLSAYVARYDAHAGDAQSDWKLLGQRAGFKILRQWPSQSKKAKWQDDGQPDPEPTEAGESSSRRLRIHEDELPALRLVGSVDGTLEEIMYGSMWRSGRERFARAYFTGDGVADGAVLCSVETSSSADPFRSLSVKWALKRGPKCGLVVKHRDFCYLAAAGIVHSRKTGVRLGYRLRHSITFPSCPPFQNHSVVRGQIFLCSLFRQLNNGSVEVFHQAKYGVGGGTGTIGLSVPKLIAEKSLVETLLSLTDIRACALAKKLTRVVELTEAERAVASLSISLFQRSLDGGKYCGMCLRRLGNVLKRRCAACRHWTCAKCSERQEIVPPRRASWIHGPVIARCFCKACVAKVLHDDVTEYLTCDVDESDETHCGRWGHDEISNGEADEVYVINRRCSTAQFSNLSYYLDEHNFSRQRRSEGRQSSRFGSSSSAPRLYPKQIFGSCDDVITVNTSPAECRRRRSASAIPAIIKSVDTSDQRQLQRRLSLTVPDIMLRSDVGKRNWTSSTLALSLQSPQRQTGKSSSSTRCGPTEV